MRSTNWGGNYRYGAGVVHRPRTLDEVREVVAGARQIRALGSRHSFTAIADAAELVSLEELAADIEVDASAGTVTCGAGVRYGDLAQALARSGVALANLASLPHISVAGAVATATHGSGERNGALATSVAAVEMVRSNGSVVSVSRGDGDFDGVVVGLGAVGVVTRVTLDVEPAYEVRQHVFEGLSWDALTSHFDEIVALGYSVSAFTLWREAVDQLWVKRRVGDRATAALSGDVFGACAAKGERHPIRGLDPVNCTPQLGVAGPWYERLPHFRMGFTPSAGDEIQSEYLVPRAGAVEAISALRRLGGVLAPLLQVSEIRTVAADRLWMSPAHGRDVVAFHFTWVADEAGVRRALVEVEAALMPLAARPHWGKLFLAGADVVGARYERLEDFIALLERHDPRGALRNDWLRRHVIGD